MHRWLPAFLAGVLVVTLGAAQWTGNAGNVILRMTSLPGTCTAGDVVILTAAPVGVYSCSATNTWSLLALSSNTVPSGAIMLTLTSCPSGWSEATALDGKTIQGTLAAHGDVGATFGSDNITPAGSNSAPALAMNSYTPAGTNGTGTVTPAGTVAWPVGVPTFAGSSGTVGAETITWPVGVPTFSGTGGTVPAQTFTGSSATTSAVSGGTPAGTNGASATSGNCAATNIAAGTGSTTACKATAPNLTVSAQTFTGSALATHTHTLTATGTNGTAAFTPAGTVAWPAGVPTNSTVSFTPAGTVAWPMGVPTFAGSSSTTSAETFTGTGATLTGSVAAPTFTGNSFDNRSAGVKAIFCQKT